MVSVSDPDVQPRPSADDALSTTTSNAGDSDDAREDDDCRTLGESGGCDGGGCDGRAAHVNVVLHQTSDHMEATAGPSATPADGEVPTASCSTTMRAPRPAAPYPDTIRISSTTGAGTRRATLPRPTQFATATFNDDIHPAGAFSTNGPRSFPTARRYQTASRHASTVSERFIHGGTSIGASSALIGGGSSSSVHPARGFETRGRTLRRTRQRGSPSPRSPRDEDVDLGLDNPPISTQTSWRASPLPTTAMDTSEMALNSNAQESDALLDEADSVAAAAAVPVLLTVVDTSQLPPVAATPADANVFARGLAALATRVMGDERDHVLASMTMTRGRAWRARSTHTSRSPSSARSRTSSVRSVSTWSRTPDDSPLSDGTASMNSPILSRSDLLRSTRSDSNARSMGPERGRSAGSSSTHYEPLAVPVPTIVPPSPCDSLVASPSLRPIATPVSDDEPGSHRRDTSIGAHTALSAFVAGQPPNRAPPPALLLDPPAWAKRSSTFLKSNPDVVVVNNVALVGKSLFLFTPTSHIRQWAARIVTHRFFKAIILVLMMAQWIAMVLRVWAVGESDQFTLFSSPYELALLPIFAFYTVEILCKMIAFGAIVKPALPNLALDEQPLHGHDAESYASDPRSPTSPNASAEPLVVPSGNLPVLTLTPATLSLPREHGPHSPRFESKGSDLSFVSGKRNPPRSPSVTPSVPQIFIDKPSGDAESPNMLLDGHLVHSPVSVHATLDHSWEPSIAPVSLAPPRMPSHGTSSPTSLPPSRTGQFLEVPTATRGSLPVPADTGQPAVSVVDSDDEHDPPVARSEHERDRVISALVLHPYLRQSANRLDFIAVVSFWLYVIIGASVRGWDGLWVLRGLTALRTLRFLSLTPGMSLALDSLKVARPLLKNVIVFILFFFLILGISGVLFFKGSFSRQCLVQARGNGLDLGWVPLTPTTYCGGWIDANGTAHAPVDVAGDPGTGGTVKGHLCAYPQQCVRGQPNPAFEFASFDSIVSALLVVFTIASIENWGELMDAAIQSESLVSCWFFVVTIMVLHALLIQLFIAVIQETFASVRAQKIERRRRRQQEAEDAARIERNDDDFGRASRDGSLDRDKKPINNDQVTPTHRSSLVAPLLVTRLESVSRSTTSMDSWRDVLAKPCPAITRLRQCCQVARPKMTILWHLGFVCVLLLYGVGIALYTKHHHDIVDVPNKVLPIEFVFTAVFALETLRVWVETDSTIVFLRTHPVDLVLSVVTIALLVVPANDFAAGFQVARTYKLVGYVAPVRRLVTMTKSFYGITSVVLFMAVSIAIAATMAMQLFGGVYRASNPWLHFDSFGPAFLTVFVIMTNDNWTDNLWSSMNVRRDQFWGPVLSAAFFLMLYTALAYVIENLPIVVILDAFNIPDAEKRRRQVERHEKLHERPRSLTDAPSWMANVGSGTWAAAQIARDWLRRCRRWRRSGVPSIHSLDSNTDRPLLPTTTTESHGSNEPLPTTQRYLQRRTLIDLTTFTDSVLAPTMPRGIKNNHDSATGRAVQDVARAIARSRAWQLVIFLAILVSIVTGMWSTPLYRLQRLQRGLPVSTFGDPIYTTDVVLAIIFGIELIVNMSAAPRTFGLSRSSLIDVAVLVCMIAGLAVQNPHAHVPHLLQALRPLRVITFFSDIQSICVTLLAAVSQIGSAMLFLGLVLIPFGLWGGHMFSGSLYLCNDTSVATRAECTGVFHASIAGDLVTILQPRVWANQYRLFHWDSFRNAMVTQLVMISGEGWATMMQRAGAVRGPGLQPAESMADAPVESWWTWIFFVTFISIVYLFTADLFVGVLTRSFEIRSGQALLTSPQKAWNNITKRIASLRPRISVPANAAAEDGIVMLFSGWCCRIQAQWGRALSRTITLILILHVLLLTTDHYGQPAWLDAVQEHAFRAVLVVYALELVLRIGASGWLPFVRQSHWNVYDAVLTVSAIVFSAADLVVEEVQLARFRKLFLIGFTLRLARRVHGLHTLFSTIGESLRDIFRVYTLLAVVLTSFALVLSELFGLTRFGSNYAGEGTFRTALRSMLLLFRLITSDNWNNILDDLVILRPECVTMGSSVLDTDCGNEVVAIVLIVLWYLTSAWILLNLVISIIIANFDYVFSTQYHQLICEADLNRFRVVWARLDPNGTGVIPQSQIPALLRALPAPFDYRIYDDCHSVRRLTAPWRDSQATPPPRLAAALARMDVDEVRARKRRYNLIFADMTYKCDRGVLRFHDALRTACLHIIPTDEYLTYAEFKTWVEDLDRATMHVARVRFTGLFYMAAERRRFLKARRERAAVGDPPPETV
ncbi:calcium channel protein [Allomyces arbusculus]|nr:calcium channel protein [Allomyces arbusculus]